jgi:hypothetical protein
MNDLLETNNNFSKFYEKKTTGADLLFNKHKISNEVASLSSMSSLSSQSSVRSNKKSKKPAMPQKYDDDDDDEEEEEEIIRPKLKIKKVVNNDDDEDDEPIDDDEEDDDNDEDDDDDDDDDIRSTTSSDNIVKRKKDELTEKREILYQLKRLQDRGFNIPVSFTMQSDLQEMKQEYDRIVRDKDIDASIRFQRKMLMSFVTGTEYLNTRYDPFAIKLDGWSEQVHDNLGDFDDIFEELHDKYKAKGRKMAPELRLFISLTGSAFMFHLTSRMFKESSIPGVEEVFKSNPELMKQFQNAAAKQFVYKNTGITDNNNNQQRSRTSSSPQPSNNNNGLFGMIGNLFGGLTNTSAFNNSPSMPPPRQPERDINNIINNVHNKISTHIDDDNRIETLSISDEEITSIIEDATDVNLLKKSVRGKNKRTLNI